MIYLLSQWLIYLVIMVSHDVLILTHKGMSFVHFFKYTGPNSRIPCNNKIVYWYFDYTAFPRTVVQNNETFFGKKIITQNAWRNIVSQNWWIYFTLHVYRVLIFLLLVSTCRGGTTLLPAIYESLVWWHKLSTCHIRTWKTQHRFSYLHTKLITMEDDNENKG